MTDSLYKEIILDHYQAPHNFGQLEYADKEAEYNNPLCGDKITMQVKLEGDTISDIKFSGEGCAISMASASMLTDKLKGMKLIEVQKLTPDDITKMLDIELSPVRLKCALLSLEVAQKL